MRNARPDAIHLPVRPLRDEANYDRAVRKVECRGDAPAGSPQDDRLKILVLPVEVYEREHYSIDSPARSMQFAS